MNIRLDLIKASPRPVRTSWAEDKMNELAQSIREQGVIVPVKVRPNGDDFELVYGHRRVEAARRAGLAEIPAFIEGVDDTDALIQALIENMQREDMEPGDIHASSIALMAARGWSTFEELSDHGVLGLGKAQRLRKFGQLSPDIQHNVGQEKPLGWRHIDAAGAGLPAGPQRPEHHVQKEAVLRKAISEDLTAAETRRVAEAIRDAPNEQVKQALLDTPVHRDTDSWEEEADVTAYFGEKERKETYEWAPAIKELLEDLKRSKSILARGKDSQRLGKLGPEHMPYIATQIRKFATWLMAWADELDEHRKEIIDG